MADILFGKKFDFKFSKGRNNSMPWQETMTKLEEAVKDAQEKEEKLNEVTAEFNTAKEEYSTAVALVNSLRDELSTTVGQLFQSNPRVRVS